MNPTTSESRCPKCGGELRRSRLSSPHAENEDETVYMSRFCRNQSLMLGRAQDGSWSVTVSSMHFR